MNINHYFPAPLTSARVGFALLQQSHLILPRPTGRGTPREPVCGAANAARTRRSSQHRFCCQPAERPGRRNKKKNLL